MGKKRRGRCVLRNKQRQQAEPKELKYAPHSFVIHHGKVGLFVLRLVKDMRRVMEPFTASSLKVTKRNCLKDFVAISGTLHVSHLCVFSRTDSGLYYKVVCVPRGPTLNFRVHNYTLAKDVVSSRKTSLIFQKQFIYPPLVILNGFNGSDKHLKLIAITFQNMFPAINLLDVNLSRIKRCVLINYDSATKLIDFRHFSIKTVAAGFSKSVKKIVQHKIPNLSKYKDVSEFFTNPIQLSESEFEDATNVVLSEDLASKGKLATNISSIRVLEIGPRMTLELYKVESGCLEGETLYHSFIKKSKEEVNLLAQKIKEKQKLKAQRKAQQEANVRKKAKVKKYLQELSTKGNQNKSKVRKEEVKTNDEEEEEEEEESEDDDAEWYKQEVGEKPEQDLFSSSSGGIKRRKMTPTGLIHKKKTKKAKVAT